MTGADPHPCPVCEHLTLSAPSPSGESCAICGWRDDLPPDADPSETGGNRIKLARARVNFRCLAVSDPGRRSEVRPPRPEELPPA